MKCLICKTGDTSPGLAVLAFPEGRHVFVVRGVPADVCNTCGEEYVNSGVGRQIFALLDGAQRSGEVDLIEFHAA